MWGVFMQKTPNVAETDTFDRFFETSFDCKFKGILKDMAANRDDWRILENDVVNYYA